MHDLTCTFKGCNENIHVHKAISIHGELSENYNSIKMLMLVWLIPFYNCLLISRELYPASSQ